MNEITVHGNVVTDPESKTVRDGMAMTKFRMALRRRRFDRARGCWVDMASVFQDVVAFNGLARNTAATVTKGMTVTVTGELVDSSYTPNGANYRIQRTDLIAADIAVSLRWATAEVTRNSRQQPAGTVVEPAGPEDSRSDAEVDEVRVA